jgi:large subunit ribosomal protein L17
MRHKFAHRKLNRTSEHRKALFMNMLNSLIKYEQITTTLPKAKELKPQIDKAITLGKKNTLHSKKNLFSKLQSKTSVEKLSKILSARYGSRKGGYSRVIKAGYRYGDDAPMAVIELVDRDINAKKVDVKKKSPEVEAKDKAENQPVKKEESNKKTKLKK